MAQKTSREPAISKKEFKKELAIKIETVLTELKSSLGEKEFQHRVKKATKVLTHGMHGKKSSENGNTVEPKTKSAAPDKIKSLKKAGVKKASRKKAAVK
jgi:hypothetical protein